MKTLILTILIAYLLVGFILPRAFVLYYGDQKNVTIAFQKCELENCELTGNLHTDLISGDQTLITADGKSRPVRDGNWYWMKWDASGEKQK